jgi:hypothetical protein
MDQADSGDLAGAQHVPERPDGGERRLRGHARSLGPRPFTVIVFPLLRSG